MCHLLRLGKFFFFKLSSSRQKGFLGKKDCGGSPDNKDLLPVTFCFWTPLAWDRSSFLVWLGNQAGHSQTWVHSALFWHVCHLYNQWGNFLYFLWPANRKLPIPLDLGSTWQLGGLGQRQVPMAGMWSWIHISLWVWDQAQNVGCDISVNPLLSEGKKTPTKSHKYYIVRAALPQGHVKILISVTSGN